MRSSTFRSRAARRAARLARWRASPSCGRPNPPGRRRRTGGVSVRSVLLPTPPECPTPHESTDTQMGRGAPRARLLQQARAHCLPWSGVMQATSESRFRFLGTLLLSLPHLHDGRRLSDSRPQRPTDPLQQGCHGVATRTARDNMFAPAPIKLATSCNPGKTPQPEHPQAFLRSTRSLGHDRGSLTG